MRGAALLRGHAKYSLTRYAIARNRLDAIANARLSNIKYRNGMFEIGTVRAPQYE